MNERKQGLFITFEGIDGSGKSTQIKLIMQELAAQGREAVLTREPGGCLVSEKIREIILDPATPELTARCEALLYAASRAQHVQQVILPALERGAIVLCDRFLDSSIAYQSYGRGLGEEDIRAINGFALQGLQPDITFYFAVTDEEARERASSRKSKDRLEQEGSDFTARITQAYESLAQRAPERIIRIDASGSKQETHEKVMAALQTALDRLSL